MAQEACEAVPKKIIEAPQDFSYFYLNPIFSDFKIIIKDEKLNVHKNILFVKSEYFLEILSKNPSQTELVLNDVNSNVFKEILKFIYSGLIKLDSLDLENFVEVIKLVKQFSIKDLEDELLKNYEKYLSVESSCKLLNEAISSQMKVLTQKILEFMDKNVDEILATDLLNSLSQKAMVQLLSRDEFVAPEIKIFESVKKWRQHNEDLNNSVLNCVRLSRFSRKELIIKVGPSNLLDSRQLFDVLSAIEDESLVVQNRSANFEPFSILNENIASFDLGAKVISGENTSKLLSGQIDPKKNDECAYHELDDRSSIIIELKSIYAFNNIHFGAFNVNNYYFSYYIEVSSDNKIWSRIIDYQNYACSSHQNLYFEKVSAKYVKIVGTASSSTTTTKFYLSFVKIYLRGEIPQLVNNIIRPTKNVATPAKKAYCRWPSLLNGDTRSICSKYVNSNNIVIQLAQPYMISCVRLLLRVNETFQYLVETSVNNKDWTVAVDRQNVACKGLQHLIFKERPVVFIKITGTHSSFCYKKMPRFSCCHFECLAAS